ncbi:MAG: hypothetical protein IJ636_05625, partial [Bacteroidales bacterium]|nr:hypothetical protein [Bacteroidales bacterium]
MKRFATVVLMLCIAMMCTTPFEAQSQNRRTGGGNSGNATKKENVQTKSAGSSSSSTPRRTGSSGSGSTVGSSNKSAPATKLVTPSGQTRQSAPASRSTQTTTQRNTKPAGQTTRPAAQVQDRRGTTVGTPNSNSRSAQISRNNSSVGRQNIPSARENKAVKPATKNNSRYNDPYYNRPRERKPAAVQYHSSLPAHRGPEYVR